MKKLFFTLLLNGTIFWALAQQRVNITGQIDNINSSEKVYLGLGSLVMPLELSADGNFNIDQTIEAIPSFFYVAKVSPRGKIERQIPQVWFVDDSVEIKINWSDKSYQIKNRLAYQSISEKIEAQNGKDQIAVILDNPNEVPSLYFAEAQKEKISFVDLERLSENFNEESKSSISGKKNKQFHCG
jgi:uncharacterized protein YdeI (BOF family)